MRDHLASDFSGNTLPTDDPDVRVYIGAGILVKRFAIFATLERHVVEAFWIVVEGQTPPGLG